MSNDSSNTMNKTDTQRKTTEIWSSLFLYVLDERLEILAEWASQLGQHQYITGI